jgi:large subunit ribosomal protein L32e
MNAMKVWIKMTEKKTLPTQNALKVRARAKGKKPAFVRPESWRYNKLSPSWRRPRGIDNKVRRTIKGWPPAPCYGYMGPKIARGLHPSGYIEVLVHNVAEVAKVNVETQAARIAHTVGMKKRVLIIAEARKLGLTVLNAKAIKAVAVVEEAAVEEAKTKAAKDKVKAKPAKDAKKKHAKSKSDKKFKPAKGAKKQ